MLEEDTISEIRSVPRAEVTVVADEEGQAGVSLARTAGDLWAAGDIIHLMNLPALAAFLESRGERLQKLATDVLQRAGQTEAVAQARNAQRAELAKLSDRELAGRVARRVAAAAMAERIEEVALAGAGLVPDDIDQL